MNRHTVYASILNLECFYITERTWEHVDRISPDLIAHFDMELNVNFTLCCSKSPVDQWRALPHSKMRYNFTLKYNVFVRKILKHLVKCNCFGDDVISMKFLYEKHWEIKSKCYMLRFVLSCYKIVNLPSFALDYVTWPTEFSCLLASMAKVDTKVIRHSKWGQWSKTMHMYCLSQ